MSKTKTLFTMALLVLLGLMGAAQAQLNNTFVTAEMVTQPRTAARMGGGRRDVRQRLAHFFHRRRCRKDDSHTPLLRPACRGTRPRRTVWLSQAL